MNVRGSKEIENGLNIDLHVDMCLASNMGSYKKKIILVSMPLLLAEMLNNSQE